MNYQHYLDIAAECAKAATYTGPSCVKLGCVAVYHGTILAKGYNTDKTHTNQAKYNYLRYDHDQIHKYCPDKCHAELNVLKRIQFLDIDFSKVTLFIYREYKNGSPALAKPCLACEKFINDLHIGKIVYTADNGYVVEKFVYNKNKKKKKK